MSFQEVADTVSQSRGDDYLLRMAAAAKLGTFSRDERAFERLVELLDDPNTAVIEAATSAIVLHSGARGLREALLAMAASTDNAGYHIRDQINSMSHRGTPIGAMLRQLEAEGSVDDIQEEIREMRSMTE